MTDRKPARTYAVYVGKDRIFPNKQVIRHGQLYEIQIIPPNENYTHHMVYVHAPKWSIYVPYSSALRIWEDWMPYSGETEDAR